MLKSILLLSLILLGSICWNETGHFIVARIAELKLSQTHPKKLQQLYKLLEALQEFFPERKDSLLEPAIVPDLIFIENQNFLMYFHFINTPIVYMNDRAEELRFPDPFAYNVTYAYDLSVKAVKSSLSTVSRSKVDSAIIKSDFMGSLLLRYLVHIVGDAHQPLHTSSLFSKHLYNGGIVSGDAGGNMIPVSYPEAPEVNNLHSLWDSALGSYLHKYTYPLDTIHLDTIEKCTRDIVEEFPESYFGDKVESLDINNWIGEGFDIAQNFVYSDIDMFPVLRTQYLVNGRRLARERLALAGWRLYYVLVDLFSDMEEKKTKESEVN